MRGEYIKDKNDYLNLHFYGIESIGNFTDVSKCKKYCFDIFPIFNFALPKRY